jgi:hypothetical protein
MALSQQSEYTGGGTYFAHLDKTCNLQQGEMLLFQGQHGLFSAPHRAQVDILKPQPLISIYSRYVA